MLFTNKLLIQIAPFSPRTFYNRMSVIKQEITFTLHGNDISEQEARLIAEKMGFKDEFEKYLQKQKEQ